MVVESHELVAFLLVKIYRLFYVFHRIPQISSLELANSHFTEQEGFFSKVVNCVEALEVALVVVVHFFEEINLFSD